MSKSGPLYHDRYTPEFLKVKASRQFRNLQSQIKRTCDRLRANPYGACNSHRLKHDLAGLRSATIEGPWRVIFKVCEECRGMGDYQLPTRIDCCEDRSTDDLTITFLDIWDYHRT